VMNYVRHSVDREKKAYFHCQLILNK
jgi:predicted transcriptional regulator